MWHKRGQIKCNETPYRYMSEIRRFELQFFPIAFPSFVKNSQGAFLLK